jgi:hypothetical protein
MESETLNGMPVGLGNGHNSSIRRVREGFAYYNEDT